MDNDFDQDITKEMSAKQAQVMQTLIDKVGPSSSEEDNLNGSSIIQEMLEVKDFYNVLSKRNNVQKLAEYAFTSHPERSQAS